VKNPADDRRSKTFLKLQIHLGKLVALLLLVVVATSCQKDDPVAIDPSAAAAEPVFSVEHLDGEVLKLRRESNEGLFVDLKIPSNRAWMKNGATPGSFEIDTTRAVRISSGGYESLTYAVRDTGNEDEVKNVVVQTKSGGGHETLLVTYNKHPDGNLQLREINSLDSMEGAMTSSRGFSSGSIPPCGWEGEYCECFRIVGYIEENGVRVKPILKYERNEQHCDQEAESEIGSDNGQPPGGSNSGSYTPPDRSEPGSGYQGQDPNDFAPGGGGTPSDTGGPNNDDNDDEQDPDQNNEETDCIELSNGDCAGVVTTPLEPTNICEASLSSLVSGLEDEIACLSSNEETDMCALNTEVSDYLNSVRDSSGNITVEQEAFLKGYLDLLCIDSAVRFDRYFELYELLEDDPMALIRDCAEQNGLDTQAYIDLYEHQLPQSCEQRLTDLGDGWENQPISEGNVPMANIDYYSVVITSAPDIDGNGTPDSNAEIFEKFKDSFLNFSSGESENFQFTCSPINTTINWQFNYNTIQDATTFQSSNPVSSILLIEGGASNVLANLVANDGAVIVSDIELDNFKVSTIQTPDTGTQPFSGNREWGVITNQNGFIEIYTRAVDVAHRSQTVRFGQIWSDEDCAQNDYYNVAEATWRNLQDEVYQWIEDNDGSSVIVEPVIVPPVDKDKILDLLKSADTIDRINCD